MIFNIVQNFPIQTFNGHCYALKTGLDYITYHVPMTFAVKNDVSVLFERCTGFLRFEFLVSVVKNPGHNLQCYFPSSAMGQTNYVGCAPSSTVLRQNVLVGPFPVAMGALSFCCGRGVIYKHVKKVWDLGYW